MINQNIITLLSSNANITTTDIAKKLKIKRNIVDYNIKKLYNKKTIKNQYVINYNKLNFNEYIIFLKINKFQNIKENLFEKLNKNTNVRWYCETYPYYNIRISIIIKKNIDNNIINNLLLNLENHILDKEIITVNSLIKPINYGIYKIKKNTNNFSIINDNTKLKILKELIKNPNIKKYEIANKLNQSYENIRKSINELYNSNTIYTKTISFNKEIIGLNLNTQILLKTNLSKNDTIKFLKYINNTQNIGRTRELIGSYNYEITIHSQNQEKLLKTINNIEEILNEKLISYKIIFNSKNKAILENEITIFNKINNN